MNRYWGHAVSTAVLALAAGAAFPACAHDDSTLYIQGVLAPPVPSNNVCTYVVSTASTFLSRGLVDAALTDSYSPLFLVGSQMKSQANADNVKSETGRINIQGALVRVVDPADGSVWMDATVLTSGTVEPAQGTSSSYIGIGASIMDKHAISHFDPGAAAPPNPSKLAVAYVKFYGQSLGGQSIESEEYQYPVDVCNGCLVVFPPQGSVAKLHDYCSGLLPPSNEQIPCALGQDQPADCQLCFSVSPACQP
jgi:hypothetical protein